MTKIYKNINNNFCINSNKSNNKNLKINKVLKAINNFLIITINKILNFNLKIIIIIISNFNNKKVWVMMKIYFSLIINNKILKAIVL